jgi:hypothetical protein
MSTATTTRTISQAVEQGEALLQEANAAKIEADKLKAKWQAAREVHEALVLEQASTPARKIQAVTDGNAKEYAEVLQREGLIKAELVLVEIAVCQASIHFHQSYKDFTLLWRMYCRHEAERLGGPEYPEGTAKGIAAESAVGNAASMCSDASSPLGDARRLLDSLFLAASR